MSFFLQEVDVPFWFLALAFASAAPLWLHWYRYLFKKYVAGRGGIRQLFSSTVDNDLPPAEEIFGDIPDVAALETVTEKVVQKSASKKQKNRKKVDPQKKENVRIILKMLAQRGELGVLPKSIADQTGISTLETASALNYIMSKEYVEMLNSPAGQKYYLTDLGRRYCINKGLLEP